MDKFGNGRYTGINIVQAWDKKLDSISALRNIPKVTAVVDQASNMGLALTLSKRVRTLNEGSMQCIDHKINTTLQKTSEANEILNEAFIGARNLARRVHQSGHSMTELEEACLRLKTECLKLLLICPTRWNCHHKMITALQRMKEPLLYLKRHKSGFEKLVPTDDEFEYFKSLSNKVKLVKDCSDFLASEKSVRLDNALYHVKLLVQGCKNMVHSYPVETYPVIGSFFKTLLNELDKRFPMKGAGIYPLAVGNILHPTWKGDLLPDAATRHEVINRLLNESEENNMEEDVLATSQNLLQESLTPGTARKRHPIPDPSDIFSGLQQKFPSMAKAKQQQCQQDQVRPLRCEFDLYMDDKNIPSLQYSSLEWWKENVKKYPLLAKIALEFFCIPPTSAPSERSFSTPGRIISGKRTNLLSGTAQDLIMNRSNLPELESDIKNWYLGREEYSEVDQHSEGTQGSTNHSPALSVESSDSEGDIIEPTLQQMSKRHKK